MKVKEKADKGGVGLQHSMQNAKNLKDDRKAVMTGTSTYLCT